LLERGGGDVHRFFALPLGALFAHHLYVRAPLMQVPLVALRAAVGVEARDAGQDEDLAMVAQQDMHFAPVHVQVDVNQGWRTGKRLGNAAHLQDGIRAGGEVYLGRLYQWRWSTGLCQ
jgi:hypothetical protein